MIDRIGITGAGGRLGSHLVSMGMIPMDCNISDPDEVQSEVERVKPLAIINCAAYTAVDDAELSDNHDKVLDSNVIGPGILRQMYRGHLIHMSTGFVFDGENGPYKESDETAPVNFYGISKLGGEAALGIRPKEPTLIARVLDLFGPGESTDFVKAIRTVLRSGKEKALPDNLYGTPTYIPHLAEALVECVERGLTGTLHLGGTRNVTRYEWGCMIASAFGHDPDLIRPTDQIKGRADRPLNASLDVSKALKLGLPLYSPTEGLNEIKRLESSEPS